MGEEETQGGVRDSVGDGTVHRIFSLPPSPVERKGGRPGTQSYKGRAGTGHRSHGPSLPGSPHSLQKAVDMAQLRSVFPEGRTGAGVPEDSSGRELAVSSQADIHVAQGLGVYPLTSLLPLPTLIASLGMDTIFSSPHLGRMEGEWGRGPSWLGEPGRRRQ